MRRVTSFLILAGGSLVVVCAAQVPATSTATGASQVGVSAAASAASQSSSATKTTSAAPQATVARPHTAPMAPARPRSAPAAPPKDEVTVPGYDRVVVHGKELFCRTQPMPGSRIRERVCLTQAQLQAEQLNAQRLIESVERGAAVGTQVPLLSGPMGR
jgi:hypothetical protein